MENEDKSFNVIFHPSFIGDILTSRARENGEITRDEILEIHELFYDEEQNMIGFNGYVRKVQLN